MACICDNNVHLDDVNVFIFLVGINTATHTNADREWNMISFGWHKFTHFIEGERQSAYTHIQVYAIANTDSNIIKMVCAASIVSTLNEVVCVILVICFYIKSFSIAHET